MREREIQGGHQTKTEESNNDFVSVIIIRYFAGRWSRKVKNEKSFQDKQHSLDSVSGKKRKGLERSVGLMTM